MIGGLVKKMNKKSSFGESQKIVATNRKARHLYHILETFQAGIVLKGTEVKSMREGHANLQEGYAAIKNGELYLMDCHISPYSHASFDNHDPLRPRKLLMHKREIARLSGKIQAKGFTLVPLKLYFVRGKVKVDLALARGKKMWDKREDVKRRDIERDMRQNQKYT